MIGILRIAAAIMFVLFISGGVYSLTLIRSESGLMADLLVMEAEIERGRRPTVEHHLSPGEGCACAFACALAGFGVASMMLAQAEILSRLREGNYS